MGGNNPKQIESSLEAIRRAVGKGNPRLHGDVPMTATIILFPGRFLSRSSQLPSAIEVALEHIIWLRASEPGLNARQAGKLYRIDVYTWPELVNALAKKWERLPKRIRSQGW
jgi:hypothetical protein